MNITAVILCFQLMRCSFYLLEFYGNEAYNLLTNWLAFKTFSYCTDFFFCIRNIDVLICVFMAADVHFHWKAGRVSEGKGQQRRKRKQEVLRVFNGSQCTERNATMAQLLWNIQELINFAFLNIKYSSKFLVESQICCLLNSFIQYKTWRAKVNIENSELVTGSH